MANASTSMQNSMLNPIDLTDDAIDLIDLTEDTIDFIDLTDDIADPTLEDDPDAWAPISLGGAHNQRQSAASANQRFHELTARMRAETAAATTRVPQADLGKRYIFFDACSGGGNVARAALDSGLDVQCVLDNAPVECDTLRRNFPQATVLQMDLSDAIMKGNSGLAKSYDIMHVSLPCVYWSPNHTRPGQNDERNQYILLCVQSLVARVKPRLISFEQTPGLAQRTQHQDYFATFLRSLEAEDYTYRYGVFNLAEWGASQRRRRLIVFAAAPGERLPPFPPPTHGLQPGLEPFVTVNQALADIPAWASDHDENGLQAKQQRRPLEWPIQDGDQPLAQLLDTKGAKVLHPDGTRQLTVREQMRLQGFSDLHELEGRTRGDKLRMVGNAVPGGFMRAVFRSFVATLAATDQAAA